MVWVLETAYHFNKLAVIVVLKHLQKTACFVLQNKTQFDTALAIFENNISDYLILSNCLESHHELFTFDKKLARFKTVQLLKK